MKKQTRLKVLEVIGYLELTNKDDLADIVEELMSMIEDLETEIKSLENDNNDLIDRLR